MTRVKASNTMAGSGGQDFLADERGATAIEYAMIAAGVGAFIAATVLGMGSELKTTFYDKLASLFP